MWSWDGHMDNGWGLAMLLGMLGFWVLLTVAIGFAAVAVLRATRSSPTAPPAPPAVSAGTPAADSAAQGGARAGAEQILAERLARGDIEPDEYRARLAALTSPSKS